MSEPISAMVLAGGKSRRLGVDKAHLALNNGRSLVASTVAAVRTVSADIMVVAGPDFCHECLDARLVIDVYPGKGSLGGIYSGLLSAEHSHCLVVACDMPFLNVELLAHMVSLGRDYDVLIPRVGDKLEPLHAIYSKGCLPHMHDLLSRGHLRIVEFFSKVRVKYVEAADIEVFDPHHLSFFNINTPEQLATARALIESGPQSER